MKIKSTKEIHASGVKLCVYGMSGSGKTTLIKTLPRPIILSAESGLLSLAAFDLPYVEVDNLDTLREAYTWLTSSNEAKDYDSIALDSISEIAEVVLTTELQKNKDPRKAYGEMQSVMTGLIRAFRDISGKHVYFSAKAEKSQDDTGRILYGPSMPGNKLGQALPYFFDEVLALRVEKNADGQNERALQCDSDGLWQAKDRSGKLSAWEQPDLTQIINKIVGGAK